MNSLNKLQMGLIGGAIVLVFVVVLIATGVLPALKDESTERATITVWGFDASDVLESTIRAYRGVRSNVTIRYQKKTVENFEEELLNSIARGESPDVVVLPSEYLKKHDDKFSRAPVGFISERGITRDFIDAALFFMTPEKEVVGVPLYADTLILYWNKDLFTQNNIPLPPATWNEFLTISQAITKKDSSGTIVTSGAALGRARNIAHAPDILVALFLQSGEAIIAENGSVTLGSTVTTGGATLRPAESALQFFIEFSNPGKANHSWVSSFGEAQDMFLAGKLGMYLGFTSEYESLKEKNPHLAFDVAVLPMLPDGKKITTGSLFALAVPLAAPHKREAWNFIAYLTSAAPAEQYNNARGSVSVRRAAFSSYAKDPIRSVFAESVLSLALWPNPDPVETRALFSTMIENTALGRETLRSALSDARSKLKALQQ